MDYSGSVLVIGASQHLTEQSKQELASEGYSVTSEQPTALSEVLTSLHGADYCLIIVNDATLPFSTLNLQQTFQEQQINIPVLAFVSTDEAAVTRRLIEAGVDDVLHVAHMDRLTLTMRRILRDRKLHHEHDFHQLFADNPLPMYIYDRQSLDFLEVNDATIAKYGYSRDEFKQMTLKDIRPPGEVSRLLNTFTSGRPTLSLYDKTWTHRLKNGKEIEVNIADHDIKFAGKAAGLVVAIDMTERNQAERALRESEHQFKTLIEHAPEAILIADQTGKYIHVNQRACDLFGYTREELLTLPPFALVVPEDMTDSPGRLKNIFAGQTMISERRLVRKNGSEFDTIVSARALDDNRMLAMIQDISDLKQTEEALIASEARYRAIIDSQTEMVIRWLPSGEVSFANDAYYNFLGLVREEAPEINIFEHVYADDQAGLRAHAVTLIDDTAVGNYENRLVRANGEVRWTEWTNRAIFDLDGRLAEIQSVGNDITARKQAEERAAFLIHLLDVTNAASGQESALKATLQLICEHHQWSYGEVWLPSADGRVMIPGAPYYVEPASREQLQPLRSVTEQTVFAKGQGGPGRVFATKTIEWVDDLTQALVSDFPRKPLMEAAGMYTTIVVPIVVEDEVIAVVQFITTGHVPQNERQLSLLTAAVNQLGTVILRQRANDKVRVDEAHYRSLLQSFDSLILMVDVEGRISFANEVGWQRFGIPAELRSGKTLMDVFPREDAQQLMVYGQRVIKHQHGLTEERYTTLNGKQVWLHMSYQPVHNGTPDVRHILINASDISQLKYAEASLGRAATRLQILHNIDNAILKAQSANEIADAVLGYIQQLIPYRRAMISLIDFDIQSGTYLAMAGDMKDSTQQIGVAFDVPPSRIFDELVRRRYLLVNSIEEAQQWGAAYEAAFREGTNALLLTTMKVGESMIAMLALHAVNTHTFIGEHIEIVLEISDQLAIALTQVHLNEQIQAYTTDLEVRVEARTEEVAQAKTRIETILNTSGDGILVVDDNRGIQQANPAIGTLFAASAEAYIGQTLASLIHHADRSTIEEAITAASRDETLRLVEVKALRQDNTVFDAEIGIASTKRLNGDRPTYVCTFRNITARKQTEALLRQALQQEKDLSELKTRFISMASHEFRTPLATIRAATDTLGAYRSKMTEPQIDSRLVKIQNQVAHLTDIMDEVLTVARIQAKRVAFSPVETDVDAFCREVVDEFTVHPDVNHTINYQSTLPNTTIMLLDRMLMRKIISNLLGNALKYSPAGSVVDFNLSCDEVTLVMRIQDRGIGIPDADQVHLFEAFHRASNVGMIPGTGLGLTIVKQAVELHGGTLTFESRVGAGTTFVTSIPREASVKGNEA